MRNLDIAGLDLPQLVVFDALFKLGSVTAVGKALDLTQPNVSHALKKLRTAFDDELFVRSPKGMRPTVKAQELAGPITRLLAILYEEVLRPSSFSPAQSRRTFVVNTTDIGEIVFMPPLLRRIREASAHISLECVCLETPALVQAMRDGEVDLALGYLPDLTSQEIYTQSLFRHPFVCLLRDEHPALQGGLSVERYAECEHIALVGEGHGQRKFEEWIAKAGIHRHIGLRSRHFMHIPFIVRDTDLIATVPKVIAVSFMATAGLRAIEPPFDIPAIQLKQYWSERQHRDPAHVWLRRIVAELFVNKDPTVGIQLHQGLQVQGLGSRAAPGKRAGRRSPLRVE